MKKKSKKKPELELVAIPMKQATEPQAKPIEFIVTLTLSEPRPALHPLVAALMAAMVGIATLVAFFGNDLVLGTLTIGLCASIITLIFFG